jgi:hypothetical protein
VGPGYAFFIAFCFEDVKASSFSCSTKSFEAEKRGLSRVRRLIVVGPDGLARAKIPCNGSEGVAVFGMVVARAKVVLCLATPLGSRLNSIPCEILI